jgi:hypothetical protein
MAKRHFNTSLWLAARLAGILLLHPLAAAAQSDDASRAAGRQLGTEGVEAFERADYATAQVKLEKAYRVLRVPSLGLWSARALAKSGKLLEASERYREVVRLEVTEGQVAVQKDAQRDAAKELADLSPRLPSVVVQVEGASADGVAITVDGAPISSALVGERRPVNPGKHVIEAKRGQDRALATVTVGEGESKPAVLRFSPRAASAAAGSPPSTQTAGTSPTPAPAQNEAKPIAEASPFGTQRVVALAAGGVGVAGVVVGTVFGLKAKSKRDDANETCSGSSCTTMEGVQLNKDAQSAATVSTIAFIVGGVGLAGAVALWVTAPRAPSTQIGLSYNGVT